jgi:HD-GYP domain-containing protein (c-di-GMP phosphodiesterase class II)
MTTDRPYRPAMPIDVALEELHDSAGTQFDPRVVSALEHMLT